MSDFPDPYLLERLMCEVALMRHHVAYGVPPALYRICGRGHVVLLDSFGQVKPCARCHKITDARKARRLPAAA